MKCAESDNGVTVFILYIVSRMVVAGIVVLRYLVVKVMWLYVVPD